MPTAPFDAAGTGSAPVRGGRAQQNNLAGPSPAGLSRIRALNISMVVLLAVLGVAEGWTRDPLLASDAISYLDISRAISHFDWRMAFNPFWGFGYPLLLAMVRPLFPATPQGEWNMIHVLNLAIFLATWAAFLFLLRSLPVGSGGGSPQEANRNRVFLKLAAFAIFLALALCMNGVSSVEPDLLVACIFLFSLGLMLRLVNAPTSGRAAILGLVLGLILGLGYWVKNIGWPLALIVLVTGLVALYRKRRGIRPILLAFGVFVLVSAPYVAGISHAYGQFTLGLSGPLNYSFDVDLLPHWTNWQGGPLPIYGTPVHPTRQVMSDPNLFVFGEPFHSTYPPFSHIAYWYKGFHQFFNPKLQAIAILRAGYQFVKILFGQPMLYAAVGALLLLWVGLKDREEKREWLRRLRGLWPMYTPAIVAVAIYLLVHVEPRYVVGFFLVLYIVPFLAFARGGKLPSSKSQAWALAVLAVGVVLNLAIVDRAAFENVARGDYYTDNPEWVLAGYLRQQGFKPGEKVAAVGGPNAYCEWAYLDRLRIVAEMGGNPYDQRHPEKTSLQATTSQIREFWDDPALRQQVLEHFRQAGAAAVIAPAKPVGLKVAGWTQAPLGKVWVYQYQNGTGQASSRRSP